MSRRVKSDKSSTKIWLSVTPLVDALVNHNLISTGDTLSIYFNEYSSKTKYPNTWYIKPYAFKVEDKKINMMDILHWFPRFTYLNLTKTQTVNPDIIKHNNEIWKITINTISKQFIGSDGKTHKYYPTNMIHTPCNQLNPPI